MAQTPQGFYANLQTPSGVQRWRIAFRPIKGEYAVIDHKKRTVYFDTDQTRSELVDTIIHESEHLANGTGEGYDAGLEKWMDKRSGNATQMLLKAGLIRDEDD